MCDRTEVFGVFERRGVQDNSGNGLRLAGGIGINDAFIPVALRSGDAGSMFGSAAARQARVAVSLSERTGWYGSARSLA